MPLNGALDLTGIARSLLNIEVNTIIRDSMSADQMPMLPHALLDIAGWYARELCELGIDLTPFFAAAIDDVANVALAWAESSFSTDDLTIAPETFERLRWAAKKAHAERGPRGKPIPANKRAILDRICNNSDTIKEVFKHPQTDLKQYLGRHRAELLAMGIVRRSYYVAPDELVALQKMWDIGVEEIIAQTVVFVTGDVTTRVQEAFRDPKSEVLFNIHRQNIDVSLSCWHYLLDAVREVAGTTVRMLLGRPD